MLVLLAAFIVLFSVLFIALEADHDCCGEGCAICAQIHVCEDLLRNLMTVSVPVAAAWCLHALSLVFADTDCCSVHPHTLIVLKIKLSD
ncbi:MAG: hypothetical protein K6C12_14845 [Oscillospiraceae bacterium]|nr:hypothetical protein [Oscillospiraceae bacterium]